jgi:hypothetical protein
VPNIVLFLSINTLAVVTVPYSEVPVCEDILHFIMQQVLLWAQTQVEESDIPHDGPPYNAYV